GCDERSHEVHQIRRHAEPPVGELGLPRRPALFDGPRVVPVGRARTSPAGGPSRRRRALLGLVGVTGPPSRASGGTGPAFGTGLRQRAIGGAQVFSFGNPPANGQGARCGGRTSP